MWSCASGPLYVPVSIIARTHSDYRLHGDILSRDTAGTLLHVSQLLDYVRISKGEAKVEIIIATLGSILDPQLS